MKEYTLEYHSQKLSIWDYLNVLVKSMLISFLGFLLFFMMPLIYSFSGSKRGNHKISDTQMNFINYAFKTHTELWRNYAWFFALMILVTAIVILAKKKYYSRIIITENDVHVEYFMLFFGKKLVEFKRNDSTCELIKSEINPISDVELFISNHKNKVRIQLLQNPWTANKYRDKLIEINELLNTQTQSSKKDFSSFTKINL